jgi:hypothetical protein
MWEFGDNASGEKLNPFVYDAAMLGMIFDDTPVESRLKPKAGYYFRCAMKQYFACIRQFYSDGESSWFGNHPTDHAYTPPRTANENPYRRPRCKNQQGETLACEPSPELELTYVMDLGRHRDKIAKLERNFRLRLNRRCNLPKNKSFASVGSLAVSRAEMQPINAQHWSTAEMFASPNEMHAALYDTNMEAVLIRAIESFSYLDQIVQTLTDDTKSFDERGRFNDQAVFHQAMFAQDVLAPLVENQGFDALAMALDGTAKEIRLFFGTDEDRRCLKLAQQVKRDLPTPDKTNDVVQDTLEDLLFSTVTETLIKGDDTGSKVIYGQGWAQEHSDGTERRVRYRVKSDGSLAWKIKLAAEKRARETGRKVTEILDEMEQNLDEAAPVDIAGVTVIALDEADQRNMFGQICQNALENEKKVALDDESAAPYMLKAAPSREQAIQIRGTEEFLKAFRAHLIDIGVDESQLENKIQWKKESSRENLHIAKITLHRPVDGVVLPMEIQCVTEEYRAAMRYGEVSHWLFKANKLDKSKETNDEGGNAKSRRANRQQTILKRLQEAIAGLGRRKSQLVHPESVNDESAAKSWELRWHVEHFVEEETGRRAVKTVTRR